MRAFHAVVNKKSRKKEKVNLVRDYLLLNVIGGSTHNACVLSVCFISLAFLFRVEKMSS